jgi:succinyl-CoA synthetase beta subunit
VCAGVCVCGGGGGGGKDRHTECAAARVRTLASKAGAVSVEKLRRKTAKKLAKIRVDSSSRLHGGKCQRALLVQRKPVPQRE